MRKALFCIFVIYQIFFTGSFWAKDKNSVITQDQSSLINEPIANFEHLWKTMERDYALFDVKNIDWKLLYKIYRPKVTAKTTDEELFTIMSQMLGHLNDNHVVLRGMGKNFIAGILNELRMEDFSKELISKIYVRNSKELVGGNFKYGWITNNIGYFHVQFFENQSASERAIDQIIDEFENAKGIIIDIRGNDGGDEPVENAVANRFADKKRLYIKSARRNGPEYDDFEPFKSWYIEPAGRFQFTKPVILITNRQTKSAAENFTLGMKTMPHVIHIGDYTSGVFADAIGKRLPNRWLFGCSFRKFVDRNGFCWEGIGVPPDLRIFNTKEDIMKNQDKVLEFALEVIRQKTR